MISITEELIEAAAPNADAAKNGRGLVLKNKFLALHQTTDGTLLFGHCQGSGKDPYLCSADFATPESGFIAAAVPSRQFSLQTFARALYAYVQEERRSPLPNVPEELAAKRQKICARSRRRKESTLTSLRS